MNQAPLKFERSEGTSMRPNQTLIAAAATSFAAWFRFRARSFPVRASLITHTLTAVQCSSDLGAIDANRTKLTELVEEAAESWMAAEHEGRERAAEEISQLLYHAQVLMLASGLTLDDVYAHL